MDGTGGLPDWHTLPGVETRVQTVAEYQDQAIAVGLGRVS